MLDDPFVLSATDKHPRSHTTYTSSSSSSSSTAASTRFLLAPHGLPPSRPSLGSSHSYKENSLSTRPSIFSSTSAPPSTTATAGTASKKRVYFSPTPLASLKASPKHKRPWSAVLLASPRDGREGSLACQGGGGLIGAGGGGGGGGEKRSRRRQNVYSANPLLEALRGSGGEASGSSSPASDDPAPLTTFPSHSSSSSSSAAPSDNDDNSSPPTSSPSSASATLASLLPPSRPSASRVSSVACTASPPAPLVFAPPPQQVGDATKGVRRTSMGMASDPVMPFSLPGMRPVYYSQTAVVVEKGVVTKEEHKEAEEEDDDDSTTDSETESEVVSSLLLPSYVSPTKPTPLSRPALKLLPSFTASASAGPSSSSSPSLASSSPLPSPSRTQPALRRPSLTATPAPAPSAPLPSGPKSILKPLRPLTPGIGLTARNEREGSRKNGRGRHRHVIGWEDARREAVGWIEVAKEAAGGQGEVVEAGETGGKGKGKEKATTTAAGSSASKPRAGGGARSSSTRRAGVGAGGGAGGAGGNDAPPPPSDQHPPSAPPTVINGCIPHSLSPHDPTLLRTPLLTLQASLRPSSSAFIRPFRSADDGMENEKEVDDDVRAMDEEKEEHEGAWTAPTLLPDVEEAYVLLTHYFFRLPPSSAEFDPAHSLAPLLSTSSSHDDAAPTFRAALLTALHRDISNIASFPSWVASQPPPPPSTTASPRTRSRGRETNSEASSSPASSPVQRRQEKEKEVDGKDGREEKDGKKGKGKKSLTEEQMRRMRDELGAAQAAVKCVAAVVRDQRVWGMFEEVELSTLLRCIFTLTSHTSHLSVLVQRDLFPFLPFLLSSLSPLFPSRLLTPLLTPLILPTLSVTLSLPPKVDRYRLSLAESLTALAVLLERYPREMLREGRWKGWFRRAVGGLWEGNGRKGVGTRERAMRVAGGVARALTMRVEIGEGEEGEEAREWVREREEIAKEVGKEMLALLHASPKDAPIDPETKKSTTFLALLTGQMAPPPPSPGGGQQVADETASLQNINLLALLPALLGGSLKSIHAKGISPWIQPFNLLIQSPSHHVHALSALSWSHLIYAFLRTTSDKKDVPLWVFRKPDARPFNVLGSIFRNRHQGAWRKSDQADPAGQHLERKTAQRVHAKALALALVSSVYGHTVYIRHGLSSVRPSPSSLASSSDLSEAIDAPLSTDQLSHHDTIVEHLLAPYLPLLAHTSISQDTPILAWQLLGSLLRPRTAIDASATLEALINPALTFGQACAKDPERQNLVTAQAMAGAVQPGRVPGWGKQWVELRVEKVLEMVGQCLPTEKEGTIEEITQAHYTVAWQNLLRSLSLSAASSTSTSPSGLSKAINWLSTASLSPTVSAALWVSTVSRPEAKIVEAVKEVMEKDVGVFESVTAAWLRLKNNEGYEEALVRGWTALLEKGKEVSTVQLGDAIALLRLHTDSEAKVNADLYHSLAHAVNVVVWKTEPFSPALADYLTSLLTPPTTATSELRLCALLVAASHDLDLVTQEDVLALAQHSVTRLFQTEAFDEESIALVAQVVAAASDRTFPALYTFILDTLSTVLTPNNATLQLLNPLFSPALQRANDLVFLAAPPESQLETQLSLRESLLSQSTVGHPLHRPYVAFAAFWRKTFGKPEDVLQIPAELVDALSVLRELMPDFPVENLGESQGSLGGKEPVAGQPAPSRRSTLPATTTAASAPNVSSRSYDADHSHLPPTGLASSSDDDEDVTFDPVDRLSRPPSPSLYDPNHRDLLVLSATDPAEEVEQDEIEETPILVEKMRARASLASMGSSAAAAAVAETEEEQAKVKEEEEEERVRRSPRKKGAKGKGKRQRVEPEEIIIDDSEDEILVSASSPIETKPVKKPSAPPRKKARVSSRRRSSAPSSSPPEDGPVASTSAAPAPSVAPPTKKAPNPKKRAATATAAPPSGAEFEVVIDAAPLKRKRKASNNTAATASRSTRSKKGVASTPSPPLPRAAPSSSAAAAAAPAALSPGSAAIATADAEIARRFFSLPQNAVNVESMDAGAYRRLMELAKKAKEYFGGDKESL